MGLDDSDEATAGRVVLLFLTSLCSSVHMIPRYIEYFLHGRLSCCNSRAGSLFSAEIG